MLNKKNLNILKICQKKVIRAVTKSKYNAHTDQLFKQTEILPIEKVIKLEILKISHKYMHDKLPGPLNSLFDIWSHAYETRNRDLPIIKRHSTMLYNKSFLCKNATYWLQLPQSIKLITSLKTFAKNVKKTI